ncbi:hypothetical protein AWH62_16445 [Maricaulis sp. W15]|uniref:DUF2849 domain-containing protein n=1 Tax=Maricaulis sp. W15 TaxID=1772333 RepID=UPI000948ABE1|nr:DUF2849 domain-containing protein [Maricaulis sp. W15]OLF76752.1 hypothetical protein AWH62_16445 [Maricaulis sp. W15]
MKTVTANRLTDGRVIYRTATGQWSTDLAEAARLDEDQADATLEIASDESYIAVGAYLIDLENDAPGGQKWRREGIRLTGPTTGSTHTQATA